MNKVGNAELRASLQELAQLGSPVDLAVADVVRENQGEPQDLEIEQVGGFHESHTYQLKDGRAAFIACLRITNRTAKAIYPVEMEMCPFWQDSAIDWLEPRRIPTKFSKKADSGHECYRFPDGLQFPVDQVLNHVIFGHQRLMPKKPVEGLLLATGGRMPADLRHGQMLDVVLTITGSDHAEYRAPIHLFIDRVVYQPKPEKAKTIVLGRQAGGLDGAPAITDSALPGSRATVVAPDVALAELIPLTNLVE
jgi:hypothetical protein